MRRTYSDIVYFKVTKLNQSNPFWPEFFLKGFKIDYVQGTPVIRFYRIQPKMWVKGVSFEISDAIFRNAEEFTIRKVDSPFALAIAQAQFSGNA